MNRTSYDAPEDPAAALSPPVDPAPSLSPPVTQADIRLAFLPVSERAQEDARVATRAREVRARGCARSRRKAKVDDGAHYESPGVL